MGAGRVIVQWLVVAALFGGWAERCLAQVEGEWAWRPLLEHEGVVFTYIFYEEADGVNNGVVIMLHNTNNYAVDVRFKVVFRSGEATYVETVEKTLRPGEAKTGDTDKLFWIPWKDGRSVAEVGLRGYKVTRHQQEGS